MLDQTQIKIQNRPPPPPYLYTSPLPHTHTILWIFINTNATDCSGYISCLWFQRLLAKGTNPPLPRWSCDWSRAKASLKTHRLKFMPKIYLQHVLEAGFLLVQWSVCYETPYSDCLFGGHSLSGIGFIYFSVSFAPLILPWYIRTGWLGVKHQFTYWCF